MAYGSKTSKEYYETMRYSGETIKEAEERILEKRKKYPKLLRENNGKYRRSTFISK